MKRNIWTLFAICLITVALQVGPVSAGETVKIGTMNLQKVLSISKTGQAVKDSVTQKFESYQKELSLQEETLMSLKEELDKKSAVWSDEVKTNKEREFKRLVKNLEEESKYATNDMKEYEKEQVAPLLRELENIIDVYGKENNYSLILDTSKGVLFQAESIDISGVLAVELDKLHPENK